MSLFETTLENLRAGRTAGVQGLSLPARAVLLERLQHVLAEPLAVLVENNEALDRFHRALLALGRAHRGQPPVLAAVPAFGVPPGGGASPHGGLLHRRAVALAHLWSDPKVTGLRPPDFLLVASPALLSPLMPAPLCRFSLERPLPAKERVRTGLFALF